VNIDSHQMVRESLEFSPVGEEKVYGGTDLPKNQLANALCVVSAFLLKNRAERKSTVLCIRCQDLYVDVR